MIKKQFGPNRRQQSAEEKTERSGEKDLAKPARLGFRGSFDEWERLMGAVALRKGRSASSSPQIEGSWAPSRARAFA